MHIDASKHLNKNVYSWVCTLQFRIHPYLENCPTWVVMITKFRASFRFKTFLRILQNGVTAKFFSWKSPNLTQTPSTPWAPLPCSAQRLGSVPATEISSAKPRDLDLNHPAISDWILKGLKGLKVSFRHVLKDLETSGTPESVNFGCDRDFFPIQKKKMCMAEERLRLWSTRKLWSEVGMIHVSKKTNRMFHVDWFHMRGIRTRLVSIHQIAIPKHATWGYPKMTKKT